MSPMLCPGPPGTTNEVQYRGAIYTCPMQQCHNVDGSINRGSIDNFPHARHEAHDAHAYT